MLSHLLHCSQNTVSLFFSAFQEHTERMRKKLANQRQQEVDDEDDRIAKAVADREGKRDVCACFLIYVVKSTFVSVNVISTKVLMEDTVCLLLETGPPSGAHPSHANIQPFAGQRKYLHFSVIFRSEYTV